MEAGGTVTTYLEEFIKALKSSRARLEERLIAQKLKKIQDAGKSCLGWLEQDWEPVEEEDFLSNLEYLLRFLNHYVLSDETNYFLPLKAALQSESIIHEMLCLLEAERETIKERFLRPLHIKKENCAHYNTEKFIHELKRIPMHRCMKQVEKDMEKLEQNCPGLKKPPSTDENCFELAETSFLRFKESLEEFLKWVSHKQNCSSIVRSKLDLYLDSKCSCPDSWKHPNGLF
ncbi:uncharacterized protein LOC128897975 [Dryobates pubescens]|uniref:uncharacterized protein LOC128897975 n=1 Tax=Dryobates pubescens TaxID=118200 RepID=UPI0023B9BB3B|nr:uncharacterized protein LOC128897975 [Dryobates pubescens]